MFGKLFGNKASDNMSGDNLEIERKFLVQQMPIEKPCRTHIIRQGYIAREANNSVRIRQKDDQFILSVKMPDQGISRFEVEKPVTVEEAEILFNSCLTPVIRKKREIYEIGNYIWELDIFDGANRGLIVAEVELSSIDEDVLLPDWVGPEVTGSQKFYNANLSQNPFTNWGVSYQLLLDRMGG